MLIKCNNPYCGFHQDGMCGNQALSFEMGRCQYWERQNVLRESLQHDQRVIQEDFSNARINARPPQIIDATENVDFMVI